MKSIPYGSCTLPNPLTFQGEVSQGVFRSSLCSYQFPCLKDVLICSVCDSNSHPATAVWSIRNAYRQLEECP